MNTRRRDQSTDRGRGAPAEQGRRPSDEERFAYLRSTWILNPGIPHFVDVPFEGRS